VKFGLLLTAIHDRSVDPVQHVAEHEDAMRRAGELGVDTVFVGQHFLGSELRFYQPIPYLAHLATFAPDVRVATGIALLSLVNPVEAAEQVATLDVVTRGRAVYGVGLGYSEKEFAAFGVDRKTRAARFAESISVIRQLWSGDPVQHAGRFFQLDDAHPSVLPLQPGGPPIWLGGQSEPAVRRAARIGDAWYVAPFVRHDDLKVLRDVFLEERAKHGLSLDGEFPVRRDIMIAPAVEAARQLAYERSRARYQTYQKWGLDDAARAAAQEETSQLDLEEIEKRFILGPPSRCVEQIQEIAQSTGMTELDLRVHWPGSTHQEAMEQLELFFAEIAPHV